MNKQITTALMLAALCVPALSFAAAAPQAQPVPAGAPISAPAAPKGLPAKIVKERVDNVVLALKRHEQLLNNALMKVTAQSVAFKAKGGDVAEADATFATAQTKLAEVTADIANIQSVESTIDLTDRSKTPAIRQAVATTITEIRSCRDSIISGIQLLKAVKVTQPAPKP